MNIITNTLHLAKKDLMLEFRKKETLFSMALFSFASILIFSTLFNLISMPLEAKHAVSAASVWFIITFTVMLSLVSVFSRETRKNSIYSLLSLAIKPQAIFLSKLVYLIVILAFIEAITLILAVVFLRIDIQGDFLLFCVVLGIGTLDLAVAGCIVSFLTIYAKSKALAVPILFFPLILPSILIATQATTNLVLHNESWNAINNTLLLLIHTLTLLVIALLFIDELISE